METITALEIANMSGGKLIQGPETNIPVNVVMDSREVEKDSLFVALKGENTDGHKFMDGAYEKGARIFLISDLDMAKNEAPITMSSSDASIIFTDDSLVGLQELGKSYWETLDMDSIAITGSVGKTTTRDMLYSAIATKYRVGVNKKNFNSETGFPLTLLSFAKDMEVGVLEMGMDALGQIERLAELSHPRVAVITNAGISHIERLGSRENIFKAKMEIATFFGADNTLIINADDEMLSTIRNDEVPYKVIRVGSSDGFDYVIKDIQDFGINGIGFNLKTPRETLEITLPIPGHHNAVNMALAIAGAEMFGIDAKEAIGGICDMEITGSRLRIQDVSGIRIIDDSYNAAPASMVSALNMLAASDGERRIAVLGGMNELGALSDVEHIAVGKTAATSNLDLLITVGDMAKGIQQGYLENGGKGETIHFDTREDIYPEIKKLFKPADLVLIKASRSYELDLLVEEMRKSF